MIEKIATVKNEVGIHCRPSSIIITVFQEYSDHDVIIRSPKGESDLRSILGLLSLGLEHGDQVTICVSGPEENELCDKLVNKFEFNYDFPPR